MRKQGKGSWSASHTAPVAMLNLSQVSNHRSIIRYFYEKFNYTEAVLWMDRESCSRDVMQPSLFFGPED